MGSKMVPKRDIPKTNQTNDRILDRFLELRGDRDPHWPGWFISNFRVFRGGFREVFWDVLNCLSSSSPSISRANFRSNRVPTTKEAPKLILKFL